jgi:o-succinylbenzoate synthase
LSNLRIDGFDIYPFRNPLTSPFRISLGTVSEYGGALVRVRLSNGTEGWGEAAPFTSITGETWRTVLAILEELKPHVVGRDFFEYGVILDEIERMITRNTSAKAALDIALHDALAKHAKLPLNAMLGKHAAQLETTQTVGLENLDETLRQARELDEHGVTRIKIKIGGEPETDVKRIGAVREALGGDVAITVDANQGYSVRQAIQTLKRLERYEVEFCEQPVHYRDLEGMAEVRRNSNIPIMADECVHSPRDALEVVKRRAADMINIKLMKSGGILAAKRIAAIAEAADMPCMVGCMIETKVGISAGCHFATSQPIVKFADLDGHTTLTADPVKGGVDLKGSFERLVGGPGLGLSMDEASLQRLLIRSS